MPEKKTCPYGNLFIYYFDGIVDSGAFASHEDFLGNWEEDRYSFLFFSRPASERVEAFLEHRPDLNLLDHFQLDYAQWQGKDLVPFRIGTLEVIPCWLERETAGLPVGEGHALFLDPGVVFGSGAHPTTLDCLKTLQRLYTLEKPSTALDLGTGTGLLALAAVKLGSARALAVDLNPLAARTARNNIRINRMEGKIAAVQGNAEDFIDCPADLVIANIHFEVTKRLLCAKGLEQKRWMLLSGLMRSEARAVLDGMALRRFDLVEAWDYEGIWHTYLLKNRADTIGMTPK